MPSESEERFALDVEQKLAGLRFPATKQDLIEHARGVYADGEVLEFLTRMPEIDYRNMGEILSGIDAIRE